MARSRSITMIAAMLVGGVVAGVPAQAAPPPLTDVAIEQSQSHDQVKRGATVEYVLNVVNHGPRQANDVEVTDHAPTGTTVLSVESSAGTCSVGAEIACSLGSLKHAATASISFTVRADAAGSLVNRAVVAAKEADPDTASNSTSAPLAVKELQTLEEQLEFARVVSRSYHDVPTATADGFEPKDHCVDQRDFQGERLPDAGVAPAKAGAMGYHHYNPSRIDRHLDLAKPEAMIYAPTDDGGRVLVAVEYIYVDEDQNTATTEPVPDLFLGDSDAWAGPMAGHGNYADGTAMPVHYDLHVWVWRNNPDGVFAQWNPDVSCPEPHSRLPHGHH